MSATLNAGDSHPLQVRSRPPRSSHGSNAEGVRRQRIAIPGYTGHVDGKVAENIHGETFACENERATRGLHPRVERRALNTAASEPALERHTAPHAPNPPRGLTVAPRIPGYMGNIPGKVSETVIGARFAESNDAAQEIRRTNQNASCKAWLRSGCWPADTMATYKFATNRLSRLQPLFSEAEDLASYESNRRLGLTFGLRPAARDKDNFKPGDRFVHHKSRFAQTRSSSTGGGFGGADDGVPHAGIKTHCSRQDMGRHVDHNPYTGSIRYGF